MVVSLCIYVFFDLLREIRTDSCGLGALAVTRYLIEFHPLLREQYDGMGTVGVLAWITPNILPTGDGIIVGLVEEVASRGEVFSEEKQGIGALTMDPHKLNPFL